MLQTVTPQQLAQFKNKNMVRGIRNNNPGNIDYNPANDWKGQISRETIAKADPAALDPRFCQFSGPEWGLRALLSLLRTYQRKYNLHTTKEIISRWAPSTENDTNAYVASVVKSAGLPSAASVVNLNDLKTAVGFMEAIVKHENAGQTYPAEVYQQAFGLAA